MLNFIKIEESTQNKSEKLVCRNDNTEIQITKPYYYIEHYLQNQPYPTSLTSTDFAKSI